MTLSASLKTFCAIFWESLWIDPDKPLLFFTPPPPPPCLFLFTAVNTIIPSHDLFKRRMLRAISIQRVYKVTALMDLWKEVVFFSARVGGGSEASCLSSFNWFSVAIGAGLFFSAMKVQHFRAHCLDSDLQEGVRGVVQDFTLIIASIRWLAAHFGENV